MQRRGPIGQHLVVDVVGRAEDLRDIFGSDVAKQIREGTSFHGWRYGLHTHPSLQQRWRTRGGRGATGSAGASRAAYRPASGLGVSSLARSRSIALILSGSAPSVGRRPCESSIVTSAPAFTKLAAVCGSLVRWRGVWPSSSAALTSAPAARSACVRSRFA